MTKFLTRTAERAVKSFAQGVLATWLGVGQIMDVSKANDIFSDAAPWVGGAATAVFSILTSVASLSVGDHDDPSLVV